MYYTEVTISQNYYWPNLRGEICTHIKVLNSCHKNNNQNNKHGHLRAKEAEAIPWDISLVDLIVPYNIRIEDQYDHLILKYLTTSWFQVRFLSDTKFLDLVQNIRR